MAGEDNSTSNLSGNKILEKHEGETKHRKDSEQIKEQPLDLACKPSIHLKNNENLDIQSILNEHRDEKGKLTNGFKKSLEQQDLNQNNYILGNIDKVCEIFFEIFLHEYKPSVAKHNEYNNSGLLVFSLDFLSLKH